MIPQKFIEEIQARTDIGEVISGYIPLKRAGRNFKALCPFHGEKTPSFVVSSQKQIFHCFGCGEGGGVIQFLMHYEKVSFVEAVEILAKRLGLEVPAQTGEKQKVKTVLYAAVSQASDFFHRNLLNSEIQPVRDYLKARGIDGEIIKKFNIGYAFGRDTLLDCLRKKEFSLETLEKASLIVSKESGYRDLFGERIIFPVYDIRSRVVGFGARLWRDRKDAPKYINSLENPVFSKREQLYGLNFSKDDILRQDAVIVVEGYLDMIIPFVFGIKNIVASLGTALTVEQIRLIRRYTANVILVFDSDKAGQSASLRALDLLLENDLKVEIVKMPSGFDPDSLVRTKGKDYFLQLISGRQDFFDYKLGVLKTMYDLGSIDGKNRIAKEMFLTLDKISSEIKKYEYLKKLGHRLGVNEEILAAEFKKGDSKHNRFLEKSPGSFSGSFKEKSNFDAGGLSIAEKVIVKFIFTNRKAFSVIKKNLKIDDFSSSLVKKTIAYFLEKYSEKDDFSLTKVLGEIEDKEISGFISKILIDDEALLDKEVFKSSIIKLRKKRMILEKNRIKEEIKEAEFKKDEIRLKELIGKYDKINSEVRNG